MWDIEFVPLGSTLPGAGGEPSMIHVIHSQTLGRGGNVDRFSFVRNTDVVEEVVEDNLASLDYAAGEEGS
jgi:hypothetical protein